MFVHCGQTVGRIKMKLGMQVGLDPGHIVLDGDPAPPPAKGHRPPIFGPYQLWPNGRMDQDVTWYGARPRPRRLCVRGGPRSPSQKGGRAPATSFRPMFIVAKRLDMDAAGTWHGGRPQPRRFCVRWGPSPLPQKGAELPSPIFSPFLLWSNGWMHQDATWYGCRPQPRGVCVRWRPSTPPHKGRWRPEAESPNFRPMAIVAERLDGSRWHLA